MTIEGNARTPVDYKQRQRLHLLPIAFVGLALLAGLWAGLQRLGMALPPLRPTLSISHGPLMIGGVLGTLICLERAVALSAVVRRGAYLAYLAPLLCGLGGLSLVLDGPTTAARALIAAGSGGLVLIFAYIVRRYTAPYTVVMALGAVCWLIGNLRWLAGHAMFGVVHWWAAFLILTIVGERLELSRILRLSSGIRRLFLLAVGLALAGVAATIVNLDLGIRLAGAGQIALALWLLRYDLARRTIRQRGLPQFIAACLLAGYVWLAVGGGLGLWFGAVYAGPRYELLLHALLLGFVFSMIFGHAPIILPALTGRPLSFRPFFYSYLSLLHGSLILRAVAILALWQPGRQWGGLLNVAAVLLFIGSMAYRVVRSSATVARPGTTQEV